MSYRLDLHTLHLFVAVVEAGSIAAAAQRELIAASALSKRISELERQLGMSLLIRHARGVEPTHAGQTLVRSARNLLRHADDLCTQMDGHAEGTRGHVRIAANLSSITQFLAADLRAFLQEYPGVTVDLTELISSDVVRAVQENTADIGIYSQVEEPHGLETLPYHRDQLVLIAPADHPLAGKEAVPFIETLDYDHVGMHRGSAANRMLIREALAAHRSLRLRFQVTSYDALISMVTAGFGLGLMPGKTTRLYLQERLAIVRLTDPWAQRQLTLCVRPGDDTAAARALLSHLHGSAASHRETRWLPD